VTNAAQQLGEEFNCSPKTVQRLARIFRALIRPRLDAAGDRTRFELAELHFYVISVDASSIVRKEPLALLEVAEAKRRDDPKYTARRFKREVYGEDEAVGAEHPALFEKLVRRLAKMRPGDAERFASSGDATELTAILKAANERLDVARRALRRA